MIREIGHIFHLPRNNCFNQDQLSIGVNNCSLDLPQHLSKLFNLLRCILVYRPHSHHAALVLQPQAGGDLQRVVVPIPHVNILHVQLLRNLVRRFAFQGEGAGGHALLQQAGIRDTIHPNPPASLPGYPARGGSGFGDRPEAQRSAAGLTYCGSKTCLHGVQ